MGDAAFICILLGSREPGFENRPLASRVWEGLVLGLLVTAGFLVIFGTAGVVLSAGLRIIVKWMPFAALLVGAGLVLLGLYLLAGKSLPLSLPTPRMDLQSRNPKSVLLFGIAYALASLSCTLPVFLIVVSTSLTAAGFAGSAVMFLSYVAGAVALIACPCHLPFTLPLFVGLTAGTALGSWLAGNYLTVFIISTVIFISGLVLSFKWLGEEARAQPSSAEGSPREKPITVTLVTSTACKSCERAKEVWQEVVQGQHFKLEVVEINSPQGRRLAAHHNIFTTPATLINGRVALRGVPSQEDAHWAAGSA